MRYFFGVAMEKTKLLTVMEGGGTQSMNIPIDMTYP